MFFLHLQREEKRTQGVGDDGLVGRSVELVGGADQLSEAERLVDDVPTEAGSGDPAALGQRNEADAEGLERQYNSANTGH